MGELRPLDPESGSEHMACRACGFVHYENPAPCVQAWIEHEGAYLALRRANPPEPGRWNMPGGFVEPLEHPEEAVRREVREETALVVEIRELVGIYTSRYGDTGRATLDLAYRCEVADGELTLSEESEEAGWFSLPDFPEPAFSGERSALAALRRRAGAPSDG